MPLTGERVIAYLAGCVLFSLGVKATLCFVLIVGTLILPMMWATGRVFGLTNHGLAAAPAMGAAR